MPSFAYIARDDRGRIDRGTMDAASMEDVREAIRKKGFTVEEILETRVPQAAPIGFTPAMPWTTTDDAKEEKKTEKAIKAEEATYVPLVDTLRLFAGWLLGWYGLVYILGDLMTRQKLPVAVPYLDALYTSDLVLRFTIGTFLFLMMTTIHKAIGGGIGKGIALTIVGVGLFVGFHLSV